MREHLVEQKGRLKELEFLIEHNKVNTTKEQKGLAHAEEALRIAQEAGQKVQEQVQHRLCKIVTQAIQGITNKPYRFDMDFKIKRGNPEVELVIYDGQHKLDLKDDIGGGIRDIADFALRIAALLADPTCPRKLFILDEPFKDIQKDLHSKVSELLLYFRDNLGIQFIMITHEEGLCIGKSIGVGGDKYVHTEDT